MNVLWTEAAPGHAAAIRDYISQTSPFYAERMMLRLLSRTEQLESFPESGPRAPESDDFSIDADTVVPCCYWFSIISGLRYEHV